MTTAFWCLLIVCLFPYVLAGFGAAQKKTQLGTIDVNHPRLQDAQLTGMGARAVAAQKNTWEAIAVFTAAVFTAHAAGVDPGAAGRAAVAFIVFRAVHSFAYLRDIPILRTAAFFGGFVCCLSLFYMAARA